MRNSFIKNYPDGQSCGDFGKKMNSKSFREGTIVTSLAFCDFSYTIYPEKNPGPLPASSSSQLSTHRKHLVHQHPRLTSHLTVDKQDWLLYSLVDTRRRIAVEITEARNGSWHMLRTRGVELFRLPYAPYMSCKKCSLLVRAWSSHD